jgi:hypothetical protein
MNMTIFCGQYPRRARNTTLASKKKRDPNMAPGIRFSKRVRAGPQLEEHSSKRLHSTETDGHNVQEPTDGNDDIPNSPTTPGLADHFSRAAEEAMASAAHDSTGDAEGNNPTTPGLADHFSRAAEEDMASATHDSTGDAEGNVARDEETKGKF